MVLYCPLMYVDVCISTCRSWCDMASPLQYRNTALILASAFGHVECVKVLLARGAQANLQKMPTCTVTSINVYKHIDKNGQTILF